MTGADLLIECLRAQGVSTLFGMPGTQNLALYDALYRAHAEIRHVLVRNEQAATMMASGWARATGQVGVALTVPGPGASNASTGIADAYTDCQPILLITGGVDRPLHQRDRAKMFHGLDQETFFRPITRYYGCPQSADDIPKMVEEAFAAIWVGRPGPAVLEIPPDLATAECPALPIPKQVEIDHSQRPAATDVAVRTAAAVVADALRAKSRCELRALVATGKSQASVYGAGLSPSRYGFLLESFATKTDRRLERAAAP